LSISTQFVEELGHRSLGVLGLNKEQRRYRVHDNACKELGDGCTLVGAGIHKSSDDNDGEAKGSEDKAEPKACPRLGENLRIILS
jgi:hypothetical protein